MILLDTHVWIWMISAPTLLSPKARNKIENQLLVGELILSDISLWEIAMLAQKERIRIKDSFLPWMEKAIIQSRVVIQSITPEIAFESTLLPEHASDPADRIIVATAKCLGMALITKDQGIRKIKKIETIW